MTDPETLVRTRCPACRRFLIPVRTPDRSEFFVCHRCDAVLTEKDGVHSATAADLVERLPVDSFSVLQAVVRISLTQREIDRFFERMRPRRRWWRRIRDRIDE